MDAQFQKMLAGYGLTTAEILYRMPGYKNILQTFVCQEYDVPPVFPKLHGFCDFWQAKLDGPIHSVQVAHSALIRPVELRLVAGQFKLNWAVSRQLVRMLACEPFLF